MQLFKITNVGMFMNLLFSEGIFEGFYLHEADIITDSRMTIDGKRCRAFYDTDETGEGQLSEYCTWKEKKHLVFEAIKGKKLPVCMKIVLEAPATILQKASFIQGESMKYYINLKYEDRQLSVITGTASNSFSTDRETPKQWDSFAKELLIAENVSLE